MAAQTESTSTGSSASRAGAQPPSGNGQHSETGLIGRMRERATAQIETQKDRALDGLDSVAQAVRGSTQQLRDQQHSAVAKYVDQAAAQLELFAQRLRGKDLSEVVDDIERMARRQPAAFVASAFAVGLITARFLKSSAENRPSGERALPPRADPPLGTAQEPRLPAPSHATTTSPSVAAPGAATSVKSGTPSSGRTPSRRGIRSSAEGSDE